jgi:Domain of unknown function (DUF1127).
MCEKFPCRDRSARFGSSRPATGGETMHTQELDQLVSGWRLQDLGARLAAVARRVKKLVTGRLALARLDEMEDWQLHDLGISRRDLDRAHEISILEDPTTLLSEQARKRRMEIPRRRA